MRKAAEGGSETLVGPDDGRASDGSSVAVPAAARMIETFIADECVTRGFAVESELMGQGLLDLVAAPDPSSASGCVPGSGYGSRVAGRFGGAFVHPSTPWLDKKVRNDMRGLCGDMVRAGDNAMNAAMASVFERSEAR